MSNFHPTPLQNRESVIFLPRAYCQYSHSQPGQQSGIIDAGFRERVAANSARTHYFAERTHQQNKKNLWEMPMHVATRCKRSVNSNFVASGRVTTGGWGVGMCIVIIAKVSRMVCDAMMLPGLVRSHSMGRTVFVCKVDCAGGDLILCLFQRQQQLWQYPDYGRCKNYCPSRWH